MKKYSKNESIESASRTVGLAQDIEAITIELVSGESDMNEVDEALQNLMQAAEDMNGEPVTYKFYISDGVSIKVTFLVELI